MKNKKIIFGILLSLVLVYTGCKKFDEVENLNNPDKATVLASGDDLFGIAGSIVNNWFQTSHSYYCMPLAMWVASDHGTCSWGNAAMNDISHEPRMAWNNDPAYAYANTSREHYIGLYSTLSKSNDVIGQIVNEGVTIEGEGNTEMALAMCRFGQGISLGYIGLIFDQGFIVDETVNLETDPLVPVPYMDLVNKAIEYLDLCIELCENNTFTIPSDWIPGTVTYTNVELGKLANSFAARLLVYSARNKSMNESKSTDWAKVLAYAEKGISSEVDGPAFSFEPMADDIFWYSEYIMYACYGGWGQVDMYIIHMMDDNMPARFPSSGSIDDLPDQGVATSDDARLASDFQYLASCPFKPERGYYQFSTYRYSRHDDYLTTWTEPMQEMREAENDLLIAEALLRTGDPQGAIDIINAGTRVTRGNLDPVPNGASFDDILDAIVYERAIELYLTGCGLPFFDMRRMDKLQCGTPLHFPIPGQQLNVMLMPQYTFGGVDNADGINTAMDGWWCSSKGDIGNNASSTISKFFEADKPLIR